MARKFRYIDELLRDQTRPCNHPGCRNAGEHRAPLSPTQPHEYQWLCLEHVTQFNKQWDYFRGRNQNEIEAFQRDVFTGHRPTWKMHPGSRFSEQKLHAALNDFLGTRDPAYREHYLPPIPAKDQAALKTLALEHPTDLPTIKKRYKVLVKQYHPDRNPGDQAAEETFKKITQAYRHLIDSYVDTITNL